MSFISRELLNENGRVSVIICTRNRANILHQTIPSIKKSSLVQELIIVEGIAPVGAGAFCAKEITKSKKLRLFRKTIFSALRCLQLALLYKKPILLIYYPLRNWSYLIGFIFGESSNMSKKEGKRDTKRL